MKEFQQFEIENTAAVDAAEMGLQQAKNVEEEALRAKRREYAAKRKQLGFNDKGKDEVEDKILEDLEFNSKAY